MKTVNLDDEAYQLLRQKKAHREESFSHLVKRLLKPGDDVRRTAGAWKDVTDAEVAVLRSESIRTFGTVGGTRARRRQ